MDVRVESQSADETWPGGDAVEADRQQSFRIAVIGHGLFSCYSR